MDKLNEIQSELGYIKEHMIDVDAILTDEDKDDINLARKEFNEGKTISLEDLKKELGI